MTNTSNEKITTCSGHPKQLREAKCSASPQVVNAIASEGPQAGAKQSPRYRVQANRTHERGYEMQYGHWSGFALDEDRTMTRAHSIAWLVRV